MTEPTLERRSGRTDLVKALTGMRGAGKTAVMLQHLECLHSTGIPEELTYYVNLDLLGKEFGSDRLGAILQPCPDREGLHRTLIDWLLGRETV